MYTVSALRCQAGLNRQVRSLARSKQEADSDSVTRDSQSPIWKRVCATHIVFDGMFIDQNSVYENSPYQYSIFVGHAVNG